jgi:hypothetical protein
LRVKKQKTPPQLLIESVQTHPFGHHAQFPNHQPALAVMQLGTKNLQDALKIEAQIQKRRR